MTEFVDILAKLWAVVKDIGPGSTLVVSIGYYLLWQDYRADKGYLRNRDQETLSVITNLTTMLDKQDTKEDNNTVRLLESMERLTKLVETSTNRQVTLIERIERLIDERRRA